MTSIVTVQTGVMNLAHQHARLYLLTRHHTLRTLGTIGRTTSYRSLGFTARIRDTCLYTLAFSE